MGRREHSPRQTAGQDYKNYILSLLFYKRLCDQWECEADDVIVTHEAVHLAIPDHSTKFWLVVQSLCRETERAKQWLCSHQDQVTVDLATAFERAPGELRAGSVP